MGYATKEKAAAAKKTRRELRIEKGLCIDCGNEKNSVFFRMCDNCMENQRRRLKKYRAARRLINKCRCGGMAPEDRSHCQKCLDEIKERTKKRIENGFCTICGVDEASPGRRLCKRHHDYYKETHRKRQQDLKAKIFDHYGRSCKCCGDSRIEFLAIDHKNNDGYTHRKELKNSGSNLYKWLIQNGFPEEFQTLCHNCNFAKHTPGCCPHVEDRIVGLLSEAA